ncbi:hypothetical protein F0562_004778 [Nyssa sinensis]|uniref:B box-type domain-containing protein n=1 Tax=Nyssa sinensis TaxID=561372 RepID=A0A5J5AIM8_9ASTE|nr:hypothetical protein F0562_004778 [Nyssa sinensis]
MKRISLCQMEKDSKSGTTETLLPCDFCNEGTAVLYCRADSARLCLFCDQQVHSANALSLKHLRSQICDNCRSQPVSVRCSTDNLVLCSDCDCDSHGNCSVSFLHEREPVEGFSGCPSAIEFASVLGFDLMFNNSMSSNTCTSVSKSTVVTFQDLTLMNEDGPTSDSVPSVEYPAMLKLRNLSCEKYKKVVYKQLLELAKREKASVDGDGAELGPGTPTRCGLQGNSESIKFDKRDDEELLHSQTPFTSLLMLPTPVNLTENDCADKVDNVRNCNPSYRAPQIWDFHLGRSRSCEESSLLEVGYDDPGFTIKNYTDLARESSLTRELLQNMYVMNCSTIYEGMPSRNNHSRQSMSICRTSTAESKNVTIAGPSSESRLVEPRTYSSASNVQFGEQTFLEENETTKTETAAVNMRLLAQNRGNAMLRYKEKKKNRRHDSLLSFPYLALATLLLMFSNSFKIWTDMISISGTSQGRRELILERK